ncbi:amidohydrolase family protein [Neopusillimonas aromaticivorans]|nr:amidohydrolase family protein [Neopusillimonas aromaticivorans]WJJ95020.1 amidohydrolase family protein [Neopusillimonas aromaticivorans]
MHLEHRIGSIAAGHDADIVVLDRHSTPLLKFRDSYCNSIEEVMFVLMTLADDRAVKTVYINGAPASLA